MMVQNLPQKVDEQLQAIAKWLEDRAAIAAAKDPDSESAIDDRIAARRLLSGDRDPAIQKILDALEIYTMPSNCSFLKISLGKQIIMRDQIALWLGVLLGE